MGNINKNKNIKEVVAICDQLDGAVMCAVTKMEVSPELILGLIK